MGPLRPPWSLPCTGLPFAAELHEIRLRAADKALCRNEHHGSGLGLLGSRKIPGNGVAAAGVEVAQPRDSPPEVPIPLQAVWGHKDKPFLEGFCVQREKQK